MNAPDPLRSGATADATGIGEGSSQDRPPRGPSTSRTGHPDPASIGLGQSYPTGGDLDPVFSELVEEITARLQAGESVNLDDYAARHAELAEQVRGLMPLLREMAGMARRSRPGRRCR